MENFFNIIRDHWLTMGIVSAGSIIAFIILCVIIFVCLALRATQGDAPKWESESIEDEGEDAFYSQTRVEMKREIKRLEEDLEAEKKFSHDIVTVKNIVLDENLTLATRGEEMEGIIESLCNMVDQGRNEIYSYSEALEIKNNLVEQLKEENRQLEVLVEMGRENIEGTDLVNEKTQELFKKYLVSNSEDKNQNIKMENSVCVNG
jgi:hypothetical protein